MVRQNYKDKMTNGSQLKQGLEREVVD